MKNSKKSIKKRMYVLFVLLLFALVSGYFYQKFCKKIDKNKENNRDLASLKMREFLKNSEAVAFEGSEGYSYDFRSMIRLMNAGSKVWKDLEPTFESNHKKTTIDYDYITSLLQELMHERSKLKNYIWDLKGYSKSGIPIKEYRSFLYYLEVLDRHIVNMRNIMRKKDTKN